MGEIMIIDLVGSRVLGAREMSGAAGGATSNLETAVAPSSSRDYLISPVPVVRDINPPIPKIAEVNSDGLAGGPFGGGMVYAL